MEHKENMMHLVKKKHSYIQTWKTLKMSMVIHLEQGCQTDSSKGPGGCAFLFQPMKHTQFDKSVV